MCFHYSYYRLVLLESGVKPECINTVSIRASHSTRSPFQLFSGGQQLTLARKLPQGHESYQHIHWLIVVLQMSRRLTWRKRSLCRHFRLKNNRFIILVSFRETSAPAQQTPIHVFTFCKKIFMKNTNQMNERKWWRTGKPLFCNCCHEEKKTGNNAHRRFLEIPEGLIIIRYNHDQWLVAENTVDSE